jgi:hypothetical protein
LVGKKFKKRRLLTKLAQRNIGDAKKTFLTKKESNFGWLHKKLFGKQDF